MRHQSDTALCDARITPLFAAPARPASDGLCIRQMEASYSMKTFFNVLSMLLISFPASVWLWANGPSSPQPSVSIDLRPYGLQPMSDADYKRGDAELQALGSYEPRMRLIESWDIHIKGVFLSNEVLAVYYTRGGEGISHSAEELAA